MSSGYNVCVSINILEKMQTIFLITDNTQMLYCIQSNKLMTTTQIEIETVNLGKVIIEYSQNHNNQNQNFLFF